MKSILITFMLILTIYAFSQDNTSDNKFTKRKKSAIIDIDYVPPTKNLKKPSVLFDLGGNISFKSRILLKSDGTNTYFKTTSSSIETIPIDRWFVNVSGGFWGRITFAGENFFHFNLLLLLNLKNATVIPLFNVSEFYLSCKYPLGKIIIGRTTYNLKASTVFSGALDGIELNVNIPFLNFKTFVGYTGALGIFNPYFNPYQVTEYERSFVNQTNLANSLLVLQFNGVQSQRIVFATDFDIYLFAQHFNPYFLMQYDISAIAGNSGHAINTFHLGANFEGRIVENFYYKVNLAGLFGTNQKISTNQTKAIVGCALETQLRYTIVSSFNSTFLLNYSLGTGNDDNTDFFTDTHGFSKESINKFYYYGKFDGGFVLNPVLSNLQILSFKYIGTPNFKNPNFKFSFYAAFYQSFKIYPNGTISDKDANLNSSIVGSEIDAGILFNFGRNVTLDFDYGIFIPETAYSITTPKMRMGANLGINF